MAFRSYGQWEAILGLVGQGIKTAGSIVSAGQGGPSLKPPSNVWGINAGMQKFIAEVKTKQPSGFNQKSLTASLGGLLPLVIVGGLVYFFVIRK